MQAGGEHALDVRACLGTGCNGRPAAWPGKHVLPVKVRTGMALKKPLPCGFAPEAQILGQCGKNIGGELPLEYLF